MPDLLSIKYFVIREGGKKKEISDDEKKKLTEPSDKYALDQILKKRSKRKLRKSLYAHYTHNIFTTCVCV